MSLNLPWNTDGGASPVSIDPVSIDKTLAMSNPESASPFSAGNIYSDAKDLLKFYTAAKLAPGSLTSAPVSPSTPTAPQSPGNLADVLKPIAAVYAADQANKHLNRNQPIWLYVLMGFGVVTLGVILYRPKRG